MRLGTVLELAIDGVPVDVAGTYNIAGVYSFGRGLFRRGPLSGSETTYREFHRLHTDHIVLSQLKAWEGAIARVPAELEGWFLSPQFPTFRPIATKIEVAYLDWYLRREEVWQGLRQTARGMGARRDSVSPERFLDTEIPLPPLFEQRRIVARIDELATRTSEASALGEQSALDEDRLLLAAYHQVTDNARCLRMGEVAPLVRRPVEVDPYQKYPELGIRSFGKGTFHKPSLSGAEVGSKRIYRIEPNDLVFSNVFAWEGAIAVAQAEDAGRVGSHRFITCVPQEGVATSSFLCFHFLTPEGIQAIGEASPGGAGRNRTLGLEALAAIQVPVPDYYKQLWFDEIQAKVRQARLTRADMSLELDALVPSILDKAFRGEL